MLCGSVFVFLGLSALPQEGALGIIAGGCFILIGGVFLSVLFLLSALWKFNSSSLCPMLVLFIAATAFAWLTPTNDMISNVIHIPPPTVRYLLVMNGVCIIFLFIYFLLGQEKSDFPLSPADQTFGFISAGVIIAFLTIKAFSYYPMKQQVIKTYYPTPEMNQMMDALIKDEFQENWQVTVQIVCDRERILKEINSGDLSGLDKDLALDNFVRTQLVPPMGRFVTVSSYQHGSFFVSVTKAGYEALKQNSYVLSISLTGYGSYQGGVKLGKWGTH